MALYYQPVLDAIAQQPHASLERLRQLCAAVDAEDRGQITLQTGPFVRDELARFPPLESVPPAVFHETMARLLMMGAHQDLQLLVEWYEALTIRSRSSSGRIAENLQGMFAFVPVPAANLADKELDRLLVRIANALDYALPAYALAVANAPKPAPVDTAPGALPEGSFGTASFGRPTLTAVFEDGIRGFLLAWMAIHQQFLDAALLALGAGGAQRGDKLLALRERWMRMLARTVAKRSQPVRLLRLSIALARIKYGRSPRHQYLDAFLPYDARSFGFTPYDREPQDEPPGKTLWLTDLLRGRSSQLYWLLDEFGEYYAPAEAPTTAAARAEEKQRIARYAERRRLIDRVGKQARSLKLVSEDDIADFGSAYYQAVLAATPAVQGAPGVAPVDPRAVAWSALLDFLGGLLRTQTVHTEFNLDEEPIYFDRLFPRGINGSVLHDCGVYAVRLAYIVLTIADTLKTTESTPPRVSFVFLPLHVGLIVQVENFASVVTHNNMVMHLTPAQTAEWHAEWDKKPDTSGPDPTDAAALETKFLQDVAAQLFLPDVDLPLFTVPLAPVSAPPKKAEVWKLYRSGVTKIGRMFSASVNSRGSADYQFDLEFLNVMDFEKRWHDANVVPFWNEKCYELWNKLDDSKNRLYTVQKLLTDASSREGYATALEKLVKEVDDSYEKEVRPKKDELTKAFRAKPTVIGPATQRITTTSRLHDNARAIGSVGVVRQHVAKVRLGQVEEPPFAYEAGFLSRASD